MIQLFVAGASGRTGQAVVARALAAGHHVTAFVRSRTKPLPDGATIVEGDVLDAAAVAAAVTREHVIVSTLGGTALAIGTANLVAAARARGVTRILALVGAGVLQADAERLRNELPGYPPFLVNIGKQHAAVWHALRDSGLDWTLVCSPDIADGEATGTLIASADYLPDGLGRVTTGDLAALLVREAETPSCVRTRIGVNTRRAGA